MRPEYQNFFTCKIMMSERKSKDIRRVTGFMDFLGDAGGVNGSLVLIGAVLHFFFTGKDEALHLL